MKLYHINQKETQINWLKNEGVKPISSRVHIELNCDVDEWPGIPDVRYYQDPDDWDWLRNGGVIIDRYIIVE